MRDKFASGKWQVSRFFRFIIHYSTFIIFPLLLVACGGSETTVVPNPINNNPIYTIAPEFDPLYQALGGTAVLGNPISQPFNETEATPLVQYVANGRFEQTPDGAVQLMALGEWGLAGLNEQIPIIPPENNNGRSFPDTNQLVWGEFLAFYEANQGEQLLGSPISPVLQEGDLVVQYFRNGRLQLQPDLGNQVTLSDLGNAHFNQPEVQYNYRVYLLSQPVPLTAVTEVNLYGHVQAPILYGGETQNLYVTTLTPDDRPVAELRLTATLSYDDTSQTVDLNPTDDQGQSQTILDMIQIPPEKEVLVTISAYSATNSIIGSDILSFKTWW